MVFTQLAGLYSPSGKSQSSNELGWANFRLDQIVSSLALLAGFVWWSLADRFLLDKRLEGKLSKVVTKDLGHTQCRREFPALVRAAENYFGSWGERYGRPGLIQL